MTFEEFLKWLIDSIDYKEKHYTPLKSHLDQMLTALRELKPANALSFHISFAMELYWKFEESDIREWINEYDAQTKTKS